MIRPLLLSLLLLLQGIPVQQGGTITGILRSADGKPAAGVRIGAVPQTDSLEETAAGPTLSSIAETDAEGRYKLEDVPPGRYFIAAGRLDLPTYFPGTQSMALGRAVLITPGLSITGIDFALNASSVGRADPGNGQGILLLTLALEVRVEGGGKLPLLNGAASTVFADGTFEFRNVPPGYHSVVTLDNSPSVGPLAASFVVGSTDLTNVEIAPTPALPFNSKPLSSAKPAGARNPGVVPLAALRGRVIDAATGTPSSPICCCDCRSESA